MKMTEKFGKFYAEVMSEMVDGTDAKVFIAEWESESKNSRSQGITHRLSYDPSKKVLIDISLSDKNAIERKIIDIADIKRYNKWYTKEVMEKIAELAK